MSSQRKSARVPRNKLQGRRPPPLKICRESYKIRKPAPVVPSVRSVPIINRSKPVIIYMQSPKIIHTEAHNFMNLVQRLTGSSSSSYNENLTADHDSTVIRQASDVPMSSQPAESVDQNTGSFPGDHTPCDSNLTSLKNDRTQQIENRASAPEASHRAQPAGTSSADSIIIPPFSPFSPNFLVPSELRLSPIIFQELPLFSPDYRLSELICNPQRSPLYTSNLLLQSPCPTTLDMCKTPPEHQGL